jgi:16S rRNA (uracil1498-N3)-methyltransferase
VCEKVCELGVPRIIFYQAERSVVRLKDEAATTNRLERFRRIAASATRQSLQSKVADIHVVTSLAAALDIIESAKTPEERLLVCALTPEARPLRDILGHPGMAHAVIGPEGDFTSTELSLMQTRGYEAVSLGPFRLRTETAAIVAAASIQAIWGETSGKTGS